MPDCYNKITFTNIPIELYNYLGIKAVLHFFNKPYLSLIVN